MSEAIGVGDAPVVTSSVGAGFGAGLLVGAMIGVLGTIAGSLLYENFVVSPRGSSAKRRADVTRRRQEAGYAYEGRRRR